MEAYTGSICGSGVEVAQQPSKLLARVRFPSVALREMGKVPPGGRMRGPMPGMQRACRIASGIHAELSERLKVTVC